MGAGAGRAECLVITFERTARRRGYNRRVTFIFTRIRAIDFPSGTPISTEAGRGAAHNGQTIPDGLGPGTARRYRLKMARFHSSGSCGYEQARPDPSRSGPSGHRVNVMVARANFRPAGKLPQRQPAGRKAPRDEQRRPTGALASHLGAPHARKGIPGRAMRILQQEQTWERILQAYRHPQSSPSHGGADGMQTWCYARTRRYAIVRASLPGPRRRYR